MVNGEIRAGAEKISMVTPLKKVPRYMTSVNEYSADEFAAAVTQAAISILSVHGVFEVSAQIPTRREGDFQGAGCPPFLHAVPAGKSGTPLWWDSLEGKFQGHFAPEASRFSLSVILGQSPFPASRFSRKGAPVRSFHIFGGFHAAY
jgi:hypothetical protein